MNKRVKMGVVGLGQWGRHHVRILSQLPDVELVAVVDRDGREARIMAHRHETRAFLDHRALLGLVDGVVIAVPTAQHYELARDFLESGAHVLVEKPMTTTSEDASRLVELAAQKDRALLVGHVERFKPVVQRLFSLVREPLAIQIRRVRPFDSRRTMDVGVVMDLMIHDIDIMQAMLPGRFEDMRCIGVRIRNSHEDLAVAHLRTNTGCVVTLTASRVAATKEVVMEVTMDDRSLHLDFLRQSIAVRYFNGESQRVTLEGVEPLRLELMHFVECIKGEAAPLVKGEDGRRSLMVAEDLLGRMVQISPPPVRV